MLLTDSDRSLAVRVRDALPDEVDVEQTGFHPDYEPRQWNVEPDELVFTDAVQPGRGLDIVFGIVTSDAGGIEPYLTEPTIETEHPADDDVASEPDAPFFRNGTRSESGGARDGESVVDESTDDTTGSSASDSEATTARSPEAGRSESAPSETIRQDPDEGDDSETAASTGRIGGSTDDTPNQPSTMEFLDTDRSEPSSEDSPDPETGGADAAGVSSPASAARDVETGGDPDRTIEATDDGAGSSSRESVLDALIAELRETDPADDRVESVQHQLGFDSKRSLHVRLDHLESRMTSMSAYTETLKETIDEHGDPAQFLGSLDRELDDLRSMQSELGARVAAVEDEHHEQEDRLDAVEATLEETERRLEEQVSQVSRQVEDRFDSIEDELADEVDGVRDEVEVLVEDSKNDLFDTIEDAEMRLNHVLAELREEQETIEQTTTEELDRISEDLEDLRSELRSVDADSDERAASIDGRLDRIDDRIDSDVRSLTEDLTALQDEVADLREVRAVLADAFVETRDEAPAQVDDEPDDGTA